MNVGFTTNIQWKDTDLCMDFNCPVCGEFSHFDGMFAHHIQCPYCETYFKMPSEVPIERVDNYDKGKEICLYTEKDDD